VTNDLRRDLGLVARVLEAPGAFGARDADRRDRPIAGHEATRVSAAAVLGPVAFEDDRLAALGAGACPRVLGADGRIEGGAAGAFAGLRAAADLDLGARRRPNGGLGRAGGPWRDLGGASAREVFRALFIADLRAFSAAGASAGDLLPGDALLRTATNAEVQSRKEQRRSADVEVNAHDATEETRA